MCSHLRTSLRGTFWLHRRPCVFNLELHGPPGVFGYTRISICMSSSRWPCSKTVRCRQGSNLCGQSPMDFKSIALTTRPRQPHEGRGQSIQQICALNARDLCLQIWPSNVQHRQLLIVSMEEGLSYCCLETTRLRYSLIRCAHYDRGFSSHTATGTSYTGAI